MASCVDCGNATSGVRCKRCHGAFLRRTSLEETALRDAELLKLVDVDGLRGERLATRLNLSRARVGQKITAARRRTKERAKLG